MRPYAELWFDAIGSGNTVDRPVVGWGGIPLAKMGWGWHLKGVGINTYSVTNIKSLMNEKLAY